MPKQKLYKNGNSVAVTIPKDVLKQLNLRDGSPVDLQVKDEAIVVIPDKKTPKDIQPSLSPEFKQWLDDFNDKYQHDLKELAKK